MEFREIDFLGNDPKIEPVAKYILSLFHKSQNLPGIISSVEAKRAARKLLDSGYKIDQLCSGNFDNIIFEIIPNLKDMVDYLKKHYDIEENRAIWLLRDLSKHISYDKNDILNGKIDEYIEKFYYDSIIKNNVATTYNNKVPLDTHKVNISKKLFVTILGSLITTAIVVYAGKQMNIKSKLNHDSTLLANLSGFDGKYANLVNETRNKNLPSENNYSPSKIAFYIVEGLKKDHNLFEYYMYDTFRYINNDGNITNSLSIMEKIYNELKIYFYNTKELNDLHEKLIDSDTFAEWLFNQGYIARTDDDYREIEKAVTNCKALYLTQTPLDNLPSDNLKMLKKLAGAFLNTDYGIQLSKEINKELERLAGGHK